MKIITINIAGVQFDWFGKRKEALIHGLQSLSPDVVFLQETTIVHESSYDQSRDIARSIGLKAVAFAPYGNNREYEAPRLGGIAILSRWPFDYVQTRKLPSGKEKHGERAGLCTKVELEGRMITFITTHLSWRPDEKEIRQEQTRELMKFANEGDLLVIGGDFNATSDDGAVRTMREEFTDSYASKHPGSEGFTWAKENDYLSRSSRGNSRIDYIFLSPGIEIEKAHVVLNQRSPVFPSDHFGLLAEVRF